jgi:queuine tRNA-ribosyltransferase
MLCGMFGYQCIATDGKARLGRLQTPHGEVETPVFMPVGTAGSVKGVTPDQLIAAGARMILGNTYHLMLRPGAETVARLGGLHRVMAWDGPLLTDSGGYQVFSLAHMRKLSAEGVTFQSHIDGATVELTPAMAVRVQRLLGADVIMQLDECPPGQADRDTVAAAVERSARWARTSRDAWRQPLEEKRGQTPFSADACHSAQGKYQALFGIQQGGVHADLRQASAAALVELDLPGYAVGGVSVGEGHEALCDVLDATDDQLPRCRPRYLMGVGEPRDIIAAVTRGIDMFDCVLPTRNARNAQAFTWHGRLRLRNTRHAEDAAPLDEMCDCYTCRHYSRGVLRHLFMAKEMLGPTLVTIHNLHFFSTFMIAIHEAIAAGTLKASANAWLEAIYEGDE